MVLIDTEDIYPYKCFIWTDLVQIKMLLEGRGQGLKIRPPTAKHRCNNAAC